ncbi:MAG: hypothetical protein N5P05_002139 [Chroococcopsis gigantea SAG 12.99]|jgi:carotenoid cleavage dioxygenase-like enzyme|nr:carotenoid oxygenase family protein [Chlorogloea purpurea SAG 13.99]MDV3000533.1 hypothetical protein [Chroococcopsis gigantea SAG 12.99]
MNPPQFPAAIKTVKQDEIDDSQMTVIEGNLPHDLIGHVFLLAPVGHVDSYRVGDMVYPAHYGTPLYNGNGLICRLDFDSPGKVGIRTRIAKTPCYYADLATKTGTKHAEYGFSNFGLARLSTWLGVRTVANTNLVAMKFRDQQERLLLSQDVGRPYEIDTVSLEIVTPVGANWEWLEQLPLNLPFEMVMTCAHPYFDSHTQQLITVNFGKSLSTLTGSLTKANSTRLLQFVETLIERLVTWLEEPFNLARNWGILGEIREHISLIAEELSHTPETIQKITSEVVNLITEVINGQSSPLLEDLKQILDLLRQMIEGLSKIDDFLDVITWDGEGKLQKWRVTLGDGTPIKIKQTVHQIAVTEDFIIIVDTGFKVGIEQLITQPVLKNKKLEAIIRNLADYPQSIESNVYIISRADLNPVSNKITARQVTLEEAIIHFVADYQNPGREITLHAALNNAWDVAEWVRKYDDLPCKDGGPSEALGMMSGTADLHSFARYVINGDTGIINRPKSKVLQDKDISWATAIYAYNEAPELSKFNTIYWNSWGCWPDLLTGFILDLYRQYPRNIKQKELKEITSAGIPANICRLSTDATPPTLQIEDRYQFPDGHFANSIQFIPRAGKEDSSTEGYLLATVLQGDSSELWLLDAQNLEGGPLCRLHHRGLKFGFTTHSTWMKEIAPRQASYCIPVRADFAPSVTIQPPSIRELFEKQVYPYFKTAGGKGDYPPVPASITSAKRYELDISLEVFDGELPDGLEGHLFFVTPVGSVASHGLPNSAGDSIFNGDGMVYRVDFQDGAGVNLKSRIMKTPCYYADLAASQKEEYKDYKFQNYGITRFSRALGTRNQLNTAFVVLSSGLGKHDRLLVTYDGGRPYEIDPSTLELIAPVGYNREWKAEADFDYVFPPLLSTAHPGFDTEKQILFTVNYGRSINNFLLTIPWLNELEDFPVVVEDLLESLANYFEKQEQIISYLQTVFNFAHDGWEIFNRLLGTGIGISDFVYIMAWDGQGELERWKVLDEEGNPITIEQTIHQIGVTRDYIIIVDTAFKAGMRQVLNNPIPRNKQAEKLLRDTVTGQVNPDTVIYLIRRDELTAGQRYSDDNPEASVTARKIVIPLPTFHFFVDYDNPAMLITLHMAHVGGQDVAEWIHPNDTSPYHNNRPLPDNLAGLPTQETDISRLGKYVIDGESGRLVTSEIISNENLTWGIGFGTYSDYPAGPGKLEKIYWQSSGLWHDLSTKFVTNLYEHYPYRLIPLHEVLSRATNGQTKPPTLFCVDTATMTVSDSYQFPLTDENGDYWEPHMMSSPQFIHGGKGQDFIFCTVYTPKENQLWIFSADNLKGGPLCKLRHGDLSFSVTLHTAWLPRIDRSDTHYNYSLEEDYNPLISDPQMQNFFDREIYPHFPGE